MPRLLDLTADLDDLTHLATQPTALDAMLERALEALDELVPYNLGVVLELDDDILTVRAARGRLANDAVRRHTVPLATHPTVRRALETRRAMALTEDHHGSDEGDPYDAVLDLPHGHSCMVVPLFAGDATLGAITLDRDRCETYPQASVSLAGVVGRIVSLALAFAHQADRLRRAQDRLEERQAILEADVHGTDPDDRLSALPSPSMRHVVGQARQVALADTPVLLQGETGVGKEVLARAVHAWSGRGDGPFVALNGAALPEGLVESELFGHVAGAFTGADRDRAGRFVAAHGGTLLLDEVAELPLATQAKLLRVLQEGVVSPVGSDDEVKVDVRVVAATHTDLRRAVADGRFREDLYYRLAVLPLEVPPLRERPEDVPVLAQSILADLARASGKGPWSLHEDQIKALVARPWPGNVRELRNALERATLLSPPGHIDPRWLVDNRVAPIAPPLREGPVRTLAENERAHVEAVLRRTQGRVYGEGGAAELLDIKPTTLQSRMKKLGVNRKAFTA